MQRHKGRQFMASAEEGDFYGDKCYSLDKTPRANSEARLNKKVNFIFILIQKHCSVNSSSFSSFFVSSHLPGDTLEKRTDHFGHIFDTSRAHNSWYLHK